MSGLRWLVFLGAAAGGTVLFAPGCATGLVQGFDAGTTDDGGTTPTPDACTATCGGQCVDTKSDPANCGKCGTACPMGAKCVQGSCQCTAPQTTCAGKCVDTKTDPANCGQCGLACGGDGGTPMGGGTWGCVNGTCSVVCPMNKKDCGGACVDQKTDNANCGTCGNACTMGKSCLQGLCCSMGEQVCGGGDGGVGACTNTQVDPMNCGTCGMACTGMTPFCNAGTCTAGVTYSQAFVGNQIATAQCTAWNTFRASLTGTYSSITIKGTNDMVGVTCTGATANTLCQALRTNTAVGPTVCGARTWKTGTCGSGIELSANGDTCSCSNGYIVRPCITSTVNWGGVNGVTCNAASQTMTVICQ
jgi:hypothetical protein